MVTLVCAALLVPLKLDYEARGETAQALFTDLSQRLGTTLLVDPALKKEILIIRVNDVPRQEFLANIAHVLHAQWMSTDKGLVLGRPPALTKELQSREQAMHLADVQQLIEAQQKKLKSMPSPAARARAVFQAIEAGNKRAEQGLGMSLDGPRLASPATTLLHELCVAIGAQEIAAIPSGESVVYSDHPNKRQRPFPNKAGEAIRSFQDAETMLVSMVPSGPKGEQILRDPFMSDMFKNANKGIGKFALSIINRYGSMMYSLNVYSPQGEDLMYGFSGTYDLVPQTIEGAPSRQHLLGRQPLSELSSEFAGYVSLNPYISPGPAARRIGEPFPLKLRDLLTEPEKRDPLSFGVADALYGIADRRHENLIACPTESLIRSVGDATKDNLIDLDSVVLNLTSRGGAVAEDQDGWLLVMPNKPLYTESRRMDRAVLGRWLRASYLAGKMTLEDFSRFHFEAGIAADAALTRVYLSLLKSTGIRPLYEAEMYYHEFFAFVGSLTTAQKRALGAGESLRLGLLSGEQRRLADKIVGRVERDEGVTEQEVPDILMRMDELFPNGGFGDATLTIRQAESTVLENVIKLGGALGGEMNLNRTIEEMARGLASYTPAGQQFDLAGPLGGAGSIRVGKRFSVIFTFHVTTGLKAVYGASSDTFKTVNGVPVQGLPEDVRKQILDRAEQLRKK